MRPKITPSIFAKNQNELDNSLKKLKGIVKIVHLDVVDGKFAKNKSFMFQFRLKKDFVYYAHLMVKKPEKWVWKYLHKIDLFIPHIEEVKNVDKYISFMRSKKKKVAFAILPKTKVKQIAPYLKKVNYVLVLTVHPGFYGGRYLFSNLRKVKQIKKLNSKIKIIVDGGMNPRRVKKAVAKGADYIVSGNYVMGSKDVRKAIRSLKGC